MILVEEITHDSTIQQILVHNYLHIVGIAILYWDHLITFGAEVKYIWSHPRALSSLIFFFNRYFAFLGNLSVTAALFTTLSPDGCRRYNLYRQLLLVFNQFIVCVLLTLRIYALYNRDKKVLGYMLGSGAVLLGITAWALLGQRSSPSTIGTGCHIGLARDTAARIAVAWEGLCVYDSLLFGFTFFKSWKTWREMGSLAVPIVDIVFRDGAIYFGVMALANLSNILTFHFAGLFIRGGLSTFASSMSVTMISRLMLNLHESADEGLFSPASTRTTRTRSTSEYLMPYSTVIELDTLPTTSNTLTSELHPSLVLEDDGNEQHAREGSSLHASQSSSRTRVPSNLLDPVERVRFYGPRAV